MMLVTYIVKVKKLANPVVIRTEDIVGDAIEPCPSMP
jgi:hypothetical protein